MKCPKCQKPLAVLYAPEITAIGVECIHCKTQWTNERVERLGDDLRESMIRQLQNIVNHMDFEEGQS